MYIKDNIFLKQLTLLSNPIVNLCGIYFLRKYLHQGIITNLNLKFVKLRQSI